MIAAIYARKSTDQAGVVDEQRSAARQIDHARTYATRKESTETLPALKRLLAPGVRVFFCLEDRDARSRTTR